MKNFEKMEGLDVTNENISRRSTEEKNEPKTENKKEKSIEEETTRELNEIKKNAARVKRETLRLQQKQDIDAILNGSCRDEVDKVWVGTKTILITLAALTAGSALAAMMNPEIKQAFENFQISDTVLYTAFGISILTATTIAISTWCKDAMPKIKSLFDINKSQDSSVENN